MYVRDALRLTFPLSVSPENRYLVDLAAYCDESGTHGGSELVVLAGYLAEPEHWLAFEREWLQALDDLSIDMFHMTDFANQVRQFSGWAEDQRRACLQRLIDIINTHVGFSIGAVVPKPLFESVLSPNVQRVLGGAYGWAANAVFSITPQYLSPNVRVAWILESGARGAGEVLRAFQNNQRAGRDDLLSLRFEDKKRFVALQAADILAYELYRQFPKQGTGGDPRYPMRRLAEVDHKWIYAVEEDLLDSARVMSDMGFQ